MFSSLLSAPFVVASLYFLYLAWTDDPAWAPLMVPTFMVAALVYIFSPQIDWWYYSRWPKRLSKGLRMLLAQYSPFYNRLDERGKKRFEDRISLYRMGTEWMPMAWPDEAVPPDVQLALSAQAVSLTWSRPTMLLTQFETIIVYPLPFRTEAYPFQHASELYAPDGCIIFSAEQVMLAFTEPTQWYNVALHEYAKALVLSYPDLPWPDAEQDGVWERLEKVSKMPYSHIESVIGMRALSDTALLAEGEEQATVDTGFDYDGVEPLPVMIHHYRTFPDAFGLEFPEEAILFSQILDRYEAYKK